MTEPARPPRAIGWATVDLDRAARELADRLMPRAAFEVAPDCSLLGARCLVGRTDPASGPAWIVLLEPITEGRLAAALARHGESWSVTWTEDGGEAPRASVVRDGPLGPERLILGDPVSGPHRMLLETATIE